MKPTSRGYLGQITDHFCHTILRCSGRGAVPLVRVHSVLPDGVWTMTARLRALCTVERRLEAARERVRTVIFLRHLFWSLCLIAVVYLLGKWGVA